MKLFGVFSFSFFLLCHNFQPTMKMFYIFQPKCNRIKPIEITFERNNEIKSINISLKCLFHMWSDTVLSSIKIACRTKVHIIYFLRSSSQAERIH